MATIPLPNVIEAPEGSPVDLAEAFVKIQQNFEALMLVLQPQAPQETDSAGNVINNTTNITNVTTLAGVSAVGSSLDLNDDGTTLNAKRTLIFTFDGGGAELAVDSTVAGLVPWNMRIVGWTLFAKNEQGSLVVDVLFHATAAPDDITAADTITGGQEPELGSESEAAANGEQINNWAVNLTEDGYIIAKITSVTDITWACLVLETVDA